jgi:hypothetical protein
VAQLDAALQKGTSPGSGVVDRLRASVERDIADLRPHLERRAEEAEEEAKAELAENARREAEAMQALLQRQIDRVREAMRDKHPPAQLSLDFSTEEERQQAEKELRQFEADRRSWDGKLVRLQKDLETEPQSVRDGYEVRARRVEPIGLVYLWPETN